MVKIWKYEAKAAKNCAIPMIITMAACMLVSLTLLLTANALVPLNHLYEFAETSSVVLFASTATLFCVLLQIFVALSVVTMPVYLFIRYAQSMFGDEGYFTHVVPLSDNALLFGKMSFGVFATAASALVAFLFLLIEGLIFKAFGLSSYSLVSFFVDIGDVPDLGSVTVTYTALLSEILSGILSIIRLLWTMVSIYLAITLGATLLSRHKVAGTLLFLLAISMVVSFISEFMFSLISISEVFPWEQDDYNAFVILNTVWGIVFYTGLAVAAFFLCRTLLRRKLNLQ